MVFGVGVAIIIIIIIIVVAVAAAAAAAAAAYFTRECGQNVATYDKLRRNVAACAR